MTVSTAALTTALVKLGFRNVFIQGPQRVNPGRNMVGPAYTLRCIPAREDLVILHSFADRDTPQRRGVDECPAEAVFVIDSRGDANALSAGCIPATRLQVFGCAGLVPDGGCRDTSEITGIEMPAYHSRPSAPTNLTGHHAIGINDDIACGGVAVFPGDVLAGDNDGVAVIPQHLVDQVAEMAVGMDEFEAFVPERVQSGASTSGLYPPTDDKTREEYAGIQKGRREKIDG